MSRRTVNELVERVAALEATLSSTVIEIDSRLAAIEHALRLLSPGEIAASVEQVARCKAMVAANVPKRARLAIASPDGMGLAAVGHRPFVSFPQRGWAGDPDRPLGHPAAAIAHLEAQRVAGFEFLLVPEPQRSWLEAHAELANHLLGRYGVVEDPGVGLLVDLRRRMVERRDALADVLDDAVDGDRSVPVLDWTQLDLARLLPGRNIFAPFVAADGLLQYIDSTIPVVVIDDPDTLEESRRVASRNVLQVTGEAGPVVRVTEVLELAGADTPPTGSVLAVVPRSDTDDSWHARLDEAFAEAPETNVVAMDEPLAADAADAIVVLEPGVVPLPGCVPALLARLRADQGAGAVAPKLLSEDGALEAAGTVVFADGSMEGIGAGLPDIAAPWHEWVRPVCAGAGLVAARPDIVRTAGDYSLPALAAAAWSSGHRVDYQPAACAVRAFPAQASATTTASEGWDAALAARPGRPHPLDEDAWRELLARDDVEAAWR